MRAPAACSFGRPAGDRLFACFRLCKASPHGREGAPPWPFQWPNAAANRPVHRGVRWRPASRGPVSQPQKRAMETYSVQGRCCPMARGPAEQAWVDIGQWENKTQRRQKWPPGARRLARRLNPCFHWVTRPARSAHRRARLSRWCASTLSSYPRRYGRATLRRCIFATTPTGGRDAVGVSLATPGTGSRRCHRSCGCRCL